VVALVFDYINGFHDAANAIATVVSTGVLPVRTAVIIAGVLNFVGAVHPAPPWRRPSPRASPTRRS
jgi:PiT family inorganic phosphate transporter